MLVTVRQRAPLGRALLLSRGEYVGCLLGIDSSRVSRYAAPPPAGATRYAGGGVRCSVRCGVRYGVRELWHVYVDCYAM